MKLWKDIVYLTAGIGGANWLLVPMQINILGKLEGIVSWLPNTIYLVAGISGIYVVYETIVNWKKQ